MQLGHLHKRFVKVFRQARLRFYFCLCDTGNTTPIEGRVITRPGYYGGLIDHNLFSAKLAGFAAFRYHSRRTRLWPHHGTFLICRIQSSLFWLETSITFHPNGMATIYHNELYRHFIDPDSKAGYTDWYGDCQVYKHCFPLRDPSLWCLCLSLYPPRSLRIADRIFQTIKYQQPNVRT